jgi:hypothetical protein
LLTEQIAHHNGIAIITNVDAIHQIIVGRETPFWASLIIDLISSHLPPT